MDDREREKVLEQLALIWDRAFQEKRFRDALTMAFASHLIAHETKNEELEQSFLIAMRGVIDEILPPDESAKKDECSFCGSRPTGCASRGRPQCLYLHPRRVRDDVVVGSVCYANVRRGFFALRGRTP